MDYTLALQELSELEVLNYNLIDTPFFIQNEENEIEFIDSDSVFAIMQVNDNGHLAIEQFKNKDVKSVQTFILKDKRHLKNFLASCSNLVFMINSSGSIFFNTDDESFKIRIWYKKLDMEYTINNLFRVDFLSEKEKSEVINAYLKSVESYENNNSINFIFTYFSCIDKKTLLDIPLNFFKSHLNKTFPISIKKHLKDGTIYREIIFWSNFKLDTNFVLDYTNADLSTFKVVFNVDKNFITIK